MMCKRTAAVIIALFIGVVFALSANALDFDPCIVDMGYSTVPEGTEYVDILVKMPKDSSEYRSFNVKPRRIQKGYLDEEGKTVYEYTDISIDEQSEIAKYDNDGYISLTVHSSYVRMLTINSNGIGGNYKKAMQTLELYSGTGIEDIYKKYGSFKAAYVGKYGEVLKVTDSFDTEYDNADSYAFIINGDRLTLRLFGLGDASAAHRFIKAAAAAIAAVLAVTAVTLLFRLIFKRGKGKSAEGE